MECLDGHEDEDDHFPILPENWPVFLYFLSISTQWRVGFSGLVGLDYSAIEADARLSKRKIKPAVYEGIKVMERAVLETLAERTIDE